MQLACVYLPHFRVQVEALRHHQWRDRPLIIVQPAAGQRKVLDHSPQATDVHPGMPLAEAVARCPQAALIEPDHPSYIARFSRILDALGRVSPLVEGAELGLAYVGLDGLERLYGGEDGILQALQAAVSSGWAAQIGIAPNKFLAQLVARTAAAGHSQVTAEDQQAFLARFPIEVLPDSWQVLARLHSFGIHTLGQVAVLPLGALQAQLGREGQYLWQLSHGIDQSPLIPRRSEETVTVSTDFEAPVAGTTAMMLAVEMLLGQAYAHPVMRGRGARVATLEAQIFRGAPFRKRVAFKRPQPDKHDAFFAVRSALECAKLPGPLEDLRLTLSGLTGEAPQQSGLFADVRRREQLREAVRQLRQTLNGRTALYRIRMVEPWSRIPERRMMLVAYDP